MSSIKVTNNSVHSHQPRSLNGFHTSSRICTKDIPEIIKYAIKGGSKEKKEATKLLLPLTKGNSPEAKLAENAIVIINERLIGKMIKKHFPHVNSFSDSIKDDVINEGRLGISDGVKTHDEKKGEFATHACWQIRGKIGCFLRDEIKYVKHSKRFPQINNSEGSETHFEGSISKDSEEEMFSEIYYRELHEKVEDGIKQLEDRLEEMKTTAFSESQRKKIIALAKEIMALKLRLFEEKNYDEIAKALGGAQKRECAKRPFIRGLKKLIPFLGIQE